MTKGMTESEERVYEFYWAVLDRQNARRMLVRQNERVQRLREKLNEQEITKARKLLAQVHEQEVLE